MIDKQRKDKSFVKDTSFVLASQGVGLVCNLLVGITVARVLGPAGKGTLRLVLLIPGLIATLGTLGIHISNIYFLGKKKYAASLLMGNSLIFVLMLTVIVGIGYFIFIPQICRLLHLNVGKGIPALAYVVLPIALFSCYATSILQGLLRIRVQALINMIRGIVHFVLIVLFIIVIKSGVLGGIISSILASLIAVCMFACALRGVTAFKPIWDKQVFKDTMSFGMKGHIGDVMQFLNYRIDIFIVAFFLNLAQVGLYTVAVSLGEILWYVSRPISVVLFPYISSMDSRSSGRFTPKVARHTTFIVLISSAALFLLAKPVIGILYGEKFLRSVLPLLLLIPGIAAFGLYRVLISDLVGRGMPRYKSYASISALVTMIVLDLVFIPKYGIAGAAIASSLSYILGTILAIYFYLKTSHNSLSEIILIKKDDIKDYARLKSLVIAFIRKN